MKEAGDDKGPETHDGGDGATVGELASIPGFCFFHFVLRFCTNFLVDCGSESRLTWNQILTWSPRGEAEALARTQEERRTDLSLRETQ